MKTDPQKRPRYMKTDPGSAEHDGSLHVTCEKRPRKETYTCEKRPTKKTYICAKRRMKTDPQRDIHTK